VEPTIREFDSEPVLKVNIANCEEFVDFSCTGPFSIHSGSEPIMQDISSDLKWRVRLDSFEPAQFVYTLLVDTRKERSDAAALADSLKRLGFEPRIQSLGGAIRLNGKLITDNTHYRILVGEFNSEADATGYGWRLFDEFDAEVVCEKIRESRGLLEIFDEQYEKSAKIENEMLLLQGSRKVETKLYDTIFENGSENSHITEKTYPWPLIFRAGDQGGIIAIGEIPLETYLMGVLPSEMGAEYPEEALKSQAIASRSFALANIGLSHPEAVFDICSENHCQLFNGTSKFHPKTNKAVRDTSGQVLFSNKMLCEAPYTPLCGGFTDGQHLFWTNEKRKSSDCIFDGPENKQTKKALGRENKVIDWVISQPDVYCNPQGSISDTASKSMKSGFRWEITYPRKRLEEIITDKTGEDVGTLYDIIPLKRSPSGRLQEVEILGSRKNLKIRREMNIRRMLSDKLLRSSCFVIEIDIGDDGIPLTFSFLGAGQGHGAGMCQAGAVAMALAGESCKSILTHYYGKVELKKLY